jgi:hypothetical protein
MPNSNNNDYIKNEMFQECKYDNNVLKIKLTCRKFMLLVSYNVLLSKMVSPKHDKMIFRRSLKSDFSRSPPTYPYVLEHGKRSKFISMANNKCL